MATQRTKLKKAHRKVSGFNSTRRNLKKFGENMGAELQKVALATGLRVKASAEQALMTGAGRAPDPKTFELANSIRLVVMKRSVRVGTAVMHGFYQEMGTTQHRAHPWLFPAMRAHRAYYGESLKQLSVRASKGLVPEDD